LLNQQAILILMKSSQVVVVSGASSGLGQKRMLNDMLGGL